MSTGSTAIEAIVREAPASSIAPNVRPAAASAIASGSSRRRLRKTSASVAAMTSSAATSSRTIELVMLVVSAARTTGAPVTTYFPPPCSAKQGAVRPSLVQMARVARRIRAIACRRCASLMPGRRRTWIRALLRLGNR